MARSARRSEGQCSAGSALTAASRCSAAIDLSQIVIDYSADHVVTVNKQVVQMDALQEHLRGIYETRKEKTVFIIGDGAVPYGEIIQIIDAAQGAGVTKVGIVTDGMRRSAMGGM